MIQLPVSDEILLRTYDIKDAPALFKVVSANRKHLRPWLSWVDRMAQEEDAAAFIRDGLQQMEHQEGLFLAIFKKDALIGGVGMHEWKHALRKAQIGYWISKKEEGQGIVTRVVRLFVDYLFRQVRLNKVELYHLPDNLRSAAVASRAGFKTEGILRDSFLLNGRLRDLVVRGLLRSEWLERNT